MLPPAAAATFRQKKEDQPLFNKLLDLLMLVWTSGGLERTKAEHRVLLESAEFDLLRVIPTGSGVSLLEAKPV